MESTPLAERRWPVSCSQLMLLGGFELRRPCGAPVQLHARKARALLACLALQPGRVHPRERLIGLLWSERSEGQARNSLRGTLSELRKGLDGVADSVLLSTRDGVALAPGAVAVDVVELEELAASHDPAALARAAALYRGEFLEGLVIRDPAYEEWLGQERERLRRLAVQALSRLASARVAEGAFDQAVDAAQRLLSVDPLHELAYALLMQVYAGRGERGFALRAYQTCRETLARELGVEPGADVRRLYEAIRDESAPPRAVSAIRRDPAPDPRAELPELTLPSQPSLVVLPFRSLDAESHRDYFSDGITEDVITYLACFRELFVIATPSAFTFGESDLEPGQFARRLGVQFVLQGALRRSGRRVRVTAQLADAITGRQLWAERYDQELDDIFAVQDELAQTIVASLAGEIESASLSRALRKPPESLAAYDYLLRGRHYLFNDRSQDIARARRDLGRALELDSGYATAYAHLACSYLVEWESPWRWRVSEQALERGLELAQEAIALDASDSWAHWALHGPHLYRRRYALAETHLEQALRLNPNQPFYHCSSGWLLTLIGRPREAVEHGRVAYRLNPLVPDECLVALGGAHYGAGEYERVLDVLGRVRQPDAESAALRAAASAQLGRVRESRAAVQQALAAWPGIAHHDWGVFWPFENPADLEHLLEGLRRAGLSV